jgi:hypothetical protein
MSLARREDPDRSLGLGLGVRAIRLADAVAGLGMLGFGGALVYSTTRDR